MTGPAPSPTLRVTALTHRGAVRGNNEDALVVGAFTACGVDMTAPATWTVPLSAPVVVAVADGMGGHAAGETASAHAVRSLALAAPTDAAALEAVLTRVDADLLAAVTLGPEPPAGTTLVGVLLGAGVDLHFNAGDSRLYEERDGYLSQLSVDDRGHTGGLTRCLGGRATGAPDAPRIRPLGDAATGRMLLCSDGLSDLVDDSEMEDLLASPGGSSRAVKALWAAAMNASGRDNITVVLVEVEPAATHRQEWASWPVSASAGDVDS